MFEMNGYPNYTVLVTDNGHGNISEDSNFQGDPMLIKAVAMFKRARIENDMHLYWLPFISPVGLVSTMCLPVTARQRSCGKVIFPVVSVILFGVRGPF